MLQAELLGLTPEFPYEIEVYERPTRLVLVGRTRCFVYREQISFTPEGDGTSVEYRAAMRLEGWLALGNPILSLIYPRIGDDATAGIVPALDKAVQTAASPGP